MHERMVAICRARGLCRTYPRDLDHDRMWIEAHPGEPFLWAPYLDGTHLVRLRGGRAAEVVRAVTRCFRPPAWFLEDAESRFHEVGAERALAVVVEHDRAWKRRAA